MNFKPMKRIKQYFLTQQLLNFWNLLLQNAYFISGMQVHGWQVHQQIHQWIRQKYTPQIPNPITVTREYKRLQRETRCMYSSAHLLLLLEIVLGQMDHSSVPHSISFILFFISFHSFTFTHYRLWGCFLDFQTSQSSQNTQKKKYAAEGGLPVNVPIKPHTAQKQ